MCVCVVVVTVLHHSAAVLPLIADTNITVVCIQICRLPEQMGVAQYVSFGISLKTVSRKFHLLIYVVLTLCLSHCESVFRC